MIDWSQQRSMAFTIWSSYFFMSSIDFLGLTLDFSEDLLALSLFYADQAK